MRKHLLIAFTVLSVIILSGCRGSFADIDSGGVISLSDDLTSITFSDNEPVAVKFTATEKWSIGIRDIKSGEIKSAAEAWLEVSPAEGNAGCSIVTVSVKNENETDIDRKALIVIQCESVSETIEAKQPPAIADDSNI